jgi:cell division control protein 45
MRTIEGGSGGVVICLGVGGMVDLEHELGLEVDESGEGGFGGVEIWLMDSRRPWNLTNAFGSPLFSDPQTGELVRTQPGVNQGRISQAYTPGRGGVVVFDDGDIEEELAAERIAYCSLEEMPELGDVDDALDGDESETEDPPVSGQAPRKRKSWGMGEDESDEDDDGPPRQRRRSNSVCYVMFVAK